MMTRRPGELRTSPSEGQTIPLQTTSIWFAFPNYFGPALVAQLYFPSDSAKPVMKRLMNHSVLFREPDINRLKLVDNGC